MNPDQPARHIRRTWIAGLVLATGAALAAGHATTPPAIDLRVVAAREVFPALAIAELAMAGKSGAESAVSSAAAATDGPERVVVGSAGSPLALDLAAHQDGDFTLELDCPRFFEPAVLRTSVNAGGRYRLNPAIAWKLDALYAVDSSTSRSVDFQLRDARGNTVQRAAWRLRVHPMQECPLAIKDESTGTWRDTTVALATYVDENHPVIERLLMSDNSGGWYGPRDVQGAARREIQEQLYEIGVVCLRLARKQGVDFHRPDEPGTGTAGARTQFIRSFDQILTGRRGTSFDGSLLLAAILMRLGYDPQLYVFPGYCAVGTRLTPEQEIFIDPGALSKQAAREVPSDTDGTARFDPHDWLFGPGAARVQAAARKFEARDPGYAIVSIREARRAGVPALDSRWTGSTGP